MNFERLEAEITRIIREEYGLGFEDECRADSAAHYIMALIEAAMQEPPPGPVPAPDWHKLI